MSDFFSEQWIQSILSQMGPGYSSDSGLSSDSFCQEFDSLSLSVRKPDTSHSLLPLTDFFKESRANYLRQVAANIYKTRKTFLDNYEVIHRNIEEFCSNIRYIVSERERQLKARLQEIAEGKILEWDRQLSICQDALKTVNGFCICSSDSLLKEIKFVDSGEIKFEEGDLSTLRNLQGLGRISHSGGMAPGNNRILTLRCVTPKFIIGSGGVKPGEFCRPWGVCTDATGRILVSDRSNHRIQIFNESGEFLLHFGQEGNKPGEFSRPAGIAVDKYCRIIVADKDNHRIQVFTSCGTFLFMFGSHGAGQGEFSYPWDVAVNNNCDIAVSDSKNNRIQLFNESGEFLNMFNWKKTGAPDFRLGYRRLKCPRGLAFRPDGSLMVTDFDNHHILIIDQRFNKMKVFGREGTNSGQFFRPQGIACDDLGRYVVADSKNYRVQVFDAQNNVCKVFGTQGLAPGEFDCPQGISFHPNGNIVVVDFNNNRVQVF